MTAARRIHERPSRFDVLFEPVAIGPKTLKNRLINAPHFTGFGTGRPRSQEAFRSVRAEGGWAAVCMESCSIDPVSDPWPWIGMTLWDDEDARLLQPVVDAVHDHDALAGLELTHSGAYANNSHSRLVALGPSALPSPRHDLLFATQMDRRDIRAAQHLYVRAAQRARDIGFDILYLYAGFTYLPLQFLSSFHNHRTDEYGGSLENRARFSIETLERLRDAVGDDCAIPFRISVESFDRDGIGIDEALAFVELADHLVDYWDITLGGFQALWKDVAPSRFYPENHQAAWVGRVKERTSKPVVNVGRFVDPDTMATAIRTGQCDVIGCARPAIADAFLPQKIQDGRIDEIRPCIGCNMCRSRAIFDQHIVCTQDPTVGEEHRRGWHPERFSVATNSKESVLIIGGGAAGLECARVLGERGMTHVHVADRADRVGGYARLVSSMPGLGDFEHLVGYREQQLARMRDRVTLIPRLDLEVDDVLDYGADIVVCATGAHWARDGLNRLTHEAIPGAGHPHVTVPEAILAGAVVSGQIIVYDCEGYFMGAAMAELLAARGCEVTWMSPSLDVGPYLDRTNEGQEVRARLVGMGIELLASAELVAIGRDRCVISGRFGDERERPADAVVLVTTRVPNDQLFAGLQDDAGRMAAAGIRGLYAIGDCVAPRVFADVIFDGHRLAREIDGSAPESPAPMIREVMPMR